MENIQLRYFPLMCLCIFVSHTRRGVDGQCSQPPVNLAVYEGTQNTMLTCNSPTKVSYVVRPASDSLSSYTITNYDDIVTPSLRNLYDVNQAGLIIKIAQGSATMPNISTAGLYVINPNGTNRVGAKLVVVKGPPTCNCTLSNSTKLNLTCSLTYADSAYQPINAKMTWTSNGNFYKADTPAKTLKNSYYVSTSSIIIDAYDAANYQCTVTFTNATNQLSYVATNAPAFSASCTSPFCGSTTKRPTMVSTTATEMTTTQPTTTQSTLMTTMISDQCMGNLKNFAVREGQPNTILDLYVDLQNVSWQVIPTTDEFGSYQIIDYGDVRDPSLSGLYDVNQTGLIIKNAAISGEPISTAGLYIGQCANNPNKTGAKILVVQSGPLCSCTPLNYASNVSCNVTYGDATLHPIYAIVTWKRNGVVVSSSTLARRRVDTVFYAESTITTNGGASDFYTCELTFAVPTNIEFDFIATNAPDFNDSCSIEGCSMTATATQPPTTTFPPTTTTLPSTTECVCTPSTACPSPGEICAKTNECRSDGTNLTHIYDECVVKAEMYTRCDNCCPETLVCGVVVTLRNDSRWLIYDPQCDDNKCEMTVVSASCMSNKWKQLSERKVTISGMGDYVQAGYSVQFGLNVTDCSDSLTTRPAINCPVINCPMINCPVINCPAINCPVINCPVINCPMINCPVINCPMINCPVINRPVINRPRTIMYDRVFAVIIQQLSSLQVLVKTEGPQVLWST